MSNHHPLQQLAADLFGPGIFDQVGQIPFVGDSWTPPSGTSQVDPDRVLGEILGTNLNLSAVHDPVKVRDQVLKALNNAFPAVKGSDGKDVIVYSGGAAVPTVPSPGTLVGPVAVAAVSLQALSNYADHALSLIKPFEPCSNGGCGYEPLIALIRGTIHDLNRQFATGAPNEHEVDALVEALVGTESVGAAPNPDPDICTTDGYFADLQRRCGIDFKRACTPEQEQIATAFMSLFSLAAAFAGFWRSMRDADDGGFFLIEVQEIKRHLYAILTTVNRLRAAIPPTQWSIVEIPADPPILASQLWDWMQSYCATTALERLREGPDGKRSVHCTLTRFANILASLTRDASTDPAAGPCAGLPHPCDSDRVQPLIRELACHVARAVEATRGRPECNDGWKRTYAAPRYGYGQGAAPGAVV